MSDCSDWTETEWNRNGVEKEAEEAAEPPKWRSSQSTWRFFPETEAPAVKDNEVPKVRQLLGGNGFEET